MFNPDFFPTPLNLIEIMTTGIDLKGKTVLEPSAGSGAIVDFLIEAGANVIACENDNRLKEIIKTKCRLVADDFTKVTSEEISHIDYIIMNPPFSTGAVHLLHAFYIAPKGCKIISLINSETINNTYSMKRKELQGIIDQYGNVQNLGDCFSNAERKTNVNVSLITIDKPGESYQQEFAGFFTDEDPQEQQENGIMSYNVVRDLVNRYVEAVKIFDKQLQTAVQLNQLTSSFFGGNIGFQCTNDRYQLTRNEYKKELQKAGWNYIFSKMNLQKYATSGLREDINKFVEQQQNIPFTMKNIYKMIEIVIGTSGARMDKAILQAFDKITLHHADNRYNVKGWKTNSHYLVGKKFILPNCVSPAKEYGFTSLTYNYLNRDVTISDLEKALCYATGSNYDNIITLRNAINRNTYGEWYENSEFFKYKAYKNGNMHFEFKSEEIWAKFNQKVSELKGFPLFEGKSQTKYQERQTGRATQEKKNPAHVYKPTVLFEFNS